MVSVRLWIYLCVLKYTNSDLGASVSVMPKKVCDKLNFSTLMPISMCLQLADQSVCYPAGIAENILVQIRNFFIPIDFVGVCEEKRISNLLGY